MKRLIFSLVITGLAALTYAQPTGWTVNSSQYEYSMTITGTITSSGIQPTAGGDYVAAFSGEECRGVVETTYETSMDKVFFYLTVFSNTFQDEEMTLKFYDNANTATSQALNEVTFADGKNMGTVSAPFTLYLGEFSIGLSTSSVVEGNEDGAFLAKLQVPELGDDDSFNYTLVDGAADNASFNISGDSLFANTSFSIESKSTHSLEVVAVNADGLSVASTLGFNVEYKDSYAMALSDTIMAEMNAEGAEVAEILVPELSYDNSLHFDLVDGASDNAFFSITGNVLTADSVFYYSENSLYEVEIQVTNTKGLSYTDMLNVHITRKESYMVSLSDTSFVENNKIGDFLATLDVPELSDEEVHFSLVNDNLDNAFFTLTDDSLFAASVFDYDEGSVYQIEVLITNSNGLHFSHTLELYVNPEQSYSISLSDTSFVENNNESDLLAILGVPGIVDDGVLYAFASDTLDNGLFTISGDSLFAASVLDYESDSIHQIEIQVTLSDGTVFFHTLEVLVANDVSDDDATSVQHQPDASIQVYPNPCSRVLTIEVPEHAFKLATMYDLSGKQIISIPLNNKTEKLDVTAYSHGMYVLVLSDNSGRKEVRQVIVE